MDYPPLLLLRELYWRLPIPAVDNPDWLPTVDSPRSP